ncbi:MAG: hypothetical protein ACRDXC_08775 [Acidimicrobiales bacterium]
MPGVKTELTEIVTGLGMLPFASVEEAVERRPREMANVRPEHWDRVAGALTDHVNRHVAFSAWQNGRAFLRADDGLRGRIPLVIEWKGPHHPPGYDFLPADLRVDHVFLVSCKYRSQVLANLSPEHLFRRALEVRGGRSDVDWFMSATAQAYRTFYAHVRDELSSEHLPVDVEALTASDRDAIKARCARSWPGALGTAYEDLSAVVSRESARIWNEAVPTLRDREQLLWRLLRFNPAPYFILGSAGNAALRLRVATPWDWRQHYELEGFSIEPQAVAQPKVRWAAQVLERHAGRSTTVEGHVEIRWSHGRFCGFPEAKLYLDSRHADVPGYFALR